MTLDLDKARKILAESDVLVSAGQCSAATTRMAGEITAAIGNPAPSVFDSVMISGTMPSCSKWKVVPVRPMPVCASSRISSIPRSAAFCFSFTK